MTDTKGNNTKVDEVVFNDNPFNLPQSLIDCGLAILVEPQDDNNFYASVGILECEYFYNSLKFNKTKTVKFQNDANVVIEFLKLKSAKSASSLLPGVASLTIEMLLEIYYLFDEWNLDKDIVLKLIECHPNRTTLVTIYNFRKTRTIVERILPTENATTLFAFVLQFSQATETEMLESLESCIKSVLKLAMTSQKADAAQIKDWCKSVYVPLLQKKMYKTLKLVHGCALDAKCNWIVGSQPCLESFCTFEMFVQCPFVFSMVLTNNGPLLDVVLETMTLDACDLKFDFGDSKDDGKEFENYKTIVHTLLTERTTIVLNESTLVKLMQRNSFLLPMLNTTNTSKLNVYIQTKSEQVKVVDNYMFYQETFSIDTFVKLYTSCHDETILIQMLHKAFVKSNLYDLAQRCIDTKFGGPKFKNDTFLKATIEFYTIKTNAMLDPSVAIRTLELFSTIQGGCFSAQYYQDFILILCRLGNVTTITPMVSEFIEKRFYIDKMMFRKMAQWFSKAELLDYMLRDNTEVGIYDKTMERIVDKDKETTKSDDDG